MEYTVLKNFKDMYTNKYYGMGFDYTTEDAERAADLERGGYIAAKDSQAAQMVKENSANQNNQASGQNQQTNDETYTVINGKRVSLKQAQAAQEAQEAQATKTGIQKAHNNHTEAVKAGEKGTTNTITTNTTTNSKTRECSIRTTRTRATYAASRTTNSTTTAARRTNTR